MFDLTYVIFLFMDSYITRFTSLYLNVYKGLINKKILKCYVEQIELLKREYPVEEFGKILQG